MYLVQLWRRGNEVIQNAGGTIRSGYAIQLVCKCRDYRLFPTRLAGDTVRFFGFVGGCFCALQGAVETRRSNVMSESLLW